MHDNGRRDVRVAIIAPLRATRYGVAAMLRTADDTLVVWSHARAGPPAASARGTHIDVLLLDIDGPRRDWPARRDVRAQAVLGLTARADAQLIQDTLALGFSGCASLDAPTDELCRAVGVVAGGGRYVDPMLGAVFATDHAERELRPCDRTLVELVARGHTNREIGVRMGMSLRAVEADRSVLLRRLGLRDRPAVVRFALNARILTPDE